MPHRRAMVKDFMGICNGLLLLVISINLLNWIYDGFIAWYGQNNYEQWAFVESSPRIDTLAIFLSLDCILAILLLFKKWRRTLWMSIIACVCSTGLLSAFITRQLFQLFFRDYLPSSWSIRQAGPFEQWVDQLLPPTLFTLMALVLYSLQQHYRKYKQVKKLTYPQQIEKS
jgi:hypothetical protein